VNHPPVFEILAVLFAIFGAISAYYLVLGMRQGRFARRVVFSQLPRTDATGRETGYMYRDRDGFGFWLEALVQVAAVAACLISIVILVIAR